MIDHHLNPADFCRVTMSYPEMSSTSEMVFRFICRMGMFDLINKDCAACIYTGMMTDTGSFTYNSNKPEIYTIISELIKKGIDKDLIYRKVNQVYSESRLRMMGYVLYEKMKVYPEQHAALITLSLEEMNRFHYVTGDTEGFVNLPLSIENVAFSASASFTILAGAAIKRSAPLSQKITPDTACSPAFSQPSSRCTA
jgi:phosphoesterase RecJ-like protein